MRNELRKIWSERHVKLLAVVVILVSVVFANLLLNSFSFMPAINEKIIEGREALRREKASQQNVRGVLSLKKLNAALAHYQSIKDETTAYLEDTIKYPVVSDVLYLAYTDQGSALYRLKNADDFYQRNVVQIREQLKQSPQSYAAWEKPVVLKRAQKLDKPYRISFYEHWLDISSAFAFIFIVIALSAMVIGSRLFSYEKDKRMDLILAAAGPRRLRKIGRAKTAALLTLLSLEYLAGMLAFLVSYFSVTGFSGWTSQIQLYYFTSIYDLTFGEAYLLTLFIGWLGVLAIGAFVAALNAFTEKSLSSLILGVLLVLLPLAGGRIKALPLAVRKFFQMQPIQGFFMKQNLFSLQIYKFLSINVLTTTAIIICSLLLLAVCVFLMPRLFAARIKKD